MKRIEIYKFMHSPELVKLLSEAAKDQVIKISKSNGKSCVSTWFPDASSAAFIEHENGAPSVIYFNARQYLFAQFIRDVVEEKFDLSTLTNTQLHDLFDNIIVVDDKSKTISNIRHELHDLTQSIFDMPEYFEAGCYYSFYFNDARLSEADALDFIKKNIETAYILNDKQMYDVFISKFKNELTNSDVVSELNSGN